jgi:hypothetical protein
MTEDEARKKWCPMSRMMFAKSDNDVRWRVNAQDHSFNRVHYRKDGELNHEFPTTCCASRCMMWRTQHEKVTVDAGVEPEGDGWRQIAGVIDNLGKSQRVWARSMGYCGLAGKPCHPQH